ncbi:MAG: hypothetical protein LUC98_00990 [Lachnospiraceae bacterium]|nr:hypothetical protein [Lachnospiraceae bacterium]
MFCKYCGKQLAENELCDCPESVKERSTESGVAQKLGKLLSGMLRDPSKTLQDAHDDPDKIPQYIIGGIYFIAVFLFVIKLFTGIGMDFGEALGPAFLLGLVALVIKVVYALCCYLFSGDRSQKIQDHIALLCAASVPDALCSLILFLLTLLGIDNYVLILTMLFMLIVVGTLSNMGAIRTAFREQPAKGYHIFLVVTLILTILTLLIGKSIVISALKKALGGMWNYLF